jgi:uncharacterized repeat protein (TIGR04002 family)
MKNENTRKLTTTALFAAIIFLATAYLFHIPVGTAGGYIHLGDVFVYLAGAFLPLPYAMVAGGIGGGLADILTGAQIWFPATVVIKPLMLVFFKASHPKILCGRNVWGLLFGAFVTIAGYYVAEGILFQNFLSPAASIAANAIQAFASAAIFVAVGFALDRADLKKRL